jgi:DNA-binding response OmpR family regulator
MTQSEDKGGTFFYVLQESLRILFVDDDPILREFAQVHLTTETATISTADDGVAALAMLDEIRPDVVLLDLEMPRMDGFEVLQRMRQEGDHQRTPVIVQTGREDVGAIDRAFQAGATSFVVKPLNWRLLSYQVRYVHRTHQAEMSLLAASREARAEADAAQAALGELCVESSRFFAQALGVNPALKADTGGYLTALERASGLGARRAGG